MNSGETRQGNQIEIETQTIRFRELPLSDNFMFGEVMRDPVICKLFLEALLGEPIDHIEFITKEDTISDTAYYHGIRLDVFIKGSTKMYNIEMFGRRYKNYKPLLKRERYYQSSMDRRSLESGKDYSELPDSFIIFVCDFDYFNLGLAVYERKMIIKGFEDVEYDNGSHVYFLNSKYKDGNANLPILEFLDFIRNNDVEAEYKSSLMKAVCPAVKSVRSDPRKEERYMVLQAVLADERNAGIAKGMEIGEAKGMKIGIEIGEERGKSEMIKNLMKKTGCTVEQALDSLGIPEADHSKYMKLLAAQ